jgi:hypothetical protein
VTADTAAETVAFYSCLAGGGNGPSVATGETEMTTLNTEMTKTKTAEHELTIDELDSASGGFLWIGVVVGAFAVGTGIRMGIDWAVRKLF